MNVCANILQLQRTRELSTTKFYSCKGLNWSSSPAAIRSIFLITIPAIQLEKSAIEQNREAIQFDCNYFLMFLFDVL